MFRGGLGAPEIVLILAVVVLLFGAKKLPDLARGSGRALRIFKAETKGLIDDDDEKPAPAQLDAKTATGLDADSEDPEVLAAKQQYLDKVAEIEAKRQAAQPD